MKMLDKVSEYYSEKARQFGPTPESADWKDTASQELRFDMLLRVVDWSTPPTINDLGCSYGALALYLQKKHLPFKMYYGYDISLGMVQEARKVAGSNKVRFFKSNRILIEADYTFCSGTFYVRLNTPEGKWETYILRTLKHMLESSTKGIAFNCLRDNVDYKENHLYYSHPLKFIALFRGLGISEITLLENYGLYEWTMLVKKGNVL